MVIAPSGPEEVVVGAEDTSCPNETDRWIHVPDTPVSAFRRVDGRVVMLVLNRRNFPLIGPDADHVDHSQCTPILRSGHDPDPGKFNDNEWLVSALRYPGGVLAGFIHDEYHGYEHGVAGCQVASGEVQARRCWYASTTLALSHDGGVTFAPAGSGQAIAALDAPFTPDTGRVGFGNPKALVDPRDGTPYLMVTSYGESGDQDKGQCLLQGDKTDPRHWRAWDGSAFSVDMGGAYGPNHSTGTCKPVVSENVWSLRFYKPAGVFIAFGQRGHNLVYLTSRDLVTWSTPTMMGQFVPLRQWKPGTPAPTLYYGLFDPESSSPNFDTIETKPYLYFVRWRIENDRPANGHRDLMRQPVTIRAAD